METDNSNNNNSTADDFEHVEQTAGSVDAETLKLTDNGAVEQQQQKEQREHRHHNFLANNCQLMLDNESICSGNSCCSIVEMLAEMRSELRAEIGAVKTENKVLLAKMDALQVQNGEQKAQISELQAKLEVVELKAKRASMELPKMVEAMMKEMAEQMEEKQRKFECRQNLDGLETKLAEGTEKKVKQEQFEKLVGQMDDCSTALEEKINILDDKIMEMQLKFNEQLELTASKAGNASNKMQKQARDVMQANEMMVADRDKAVKAAELVAKWWPKVAALESKAFDQSKWDEVQKRMEELHKKLELLQLKQPYLKSASPNYWAKWNEDILTGNGLFAIKSGEKQTFGNVMAKFSYSTLYFEVTVKQRDRYSSIYIGVCNKPDFTAAGSKYVGGFPVSCSIRSDGHYFYNSGTRLSGYFANASFSTNDIVGCGVLPFPEIGKSVFFATKNGALIGTPIDMPLDAAKQLFPSISLNGQGACVEANFGNDLDNKPFKYNIADHKF